MPRRIQMPTPQLTPIERVGRMWLKRDDLYAIAGATGGKARGCHAIMVDASDNGIAGMVTATARSSVQMVVVARMAAKFGCPCRIHTAAAKGTTQSIERAIKAGADVVEHRPGYTSVCIARAIEDAGGLRWLYIPFGMEHVAAVREIAGQVTGIPKGVKRIVVPVGGGVTLAGVLTGLARERLDIPVVGVRVGGDPSKRIDRLGVPLWRSRVKIVNASVDYGTPVEAEIGNVILDPYYEAKCAEVLRPDDLFWIVGHRNAPWDSPAYGSTTETDD